MYSPIAYYRALSALPIVLFLTGFLHAFDASAESTGAAVKHGTLQLIGGDVFQGYMSATSTDRQDGALVWKCPSFASDLVVPWSVVERLTQPNSLPTESEEPVPSTANPQALRDSKNDFVIELQNGEAVTGSIVKIDEQLVDVECRYVGLKQFPLTSIRSILRVAMDSQSTDSTLPNNEWRQTIPVQKKDARSKWFQRLNSYETETAGTAISQSVNVPDLAAIDISVAWEQSSPNWMLTIGDPRRLELHVRKLENRNLVSLTLLIEDENLADIATAQIPSDGLSAISLRVLCDSNRGRLVLLHAGNPIAQIRVSKSIRLTGRQTVSFTNISAGRISLRELKIYRSIFTAPKMKSDDKNKANAPETENTETLLRTGETFMGMPAKFDPNDRSFGFAGGDGLGRVKLDQVDRIEFPVASAPENGPRERQFTIELYDGGRLVGQQLQRTEDHLVIAMEQPQATFRIPIAEVKSVFGQLQPVVNTNAKEGNNASAGAEPSDNMMRLTTPWALSMGTIDRVASPNIPDAKGSRPMMYWKPKNALESVALSPKITGSIGPLTPISAKSGSVKSGSTKKPESSNGRILHADEPSLFLKSGDCFPAVIDSLDETELKFTSKEFAAAKIGNEWVRGIRIATSQSAEAIEKSAKKRLLTLPRAQRNNPPTHLIVSREGDAIRGQLKAMTVDQATLEVRGEDRTIYTKNVAEIIWLVDAPVILPLNAKQDMPTETTDASTTTPDDGELRCQALYDTGTRISIIPERYENGIIFGRHPQLGACQLELSKVSRFVLGDEILSEAQRNRFGKWKLENAQDPKFVNDLDSPQDESTPSESDSPPHLKLLGQSAPDFELKKLDGSLLRLSDFKGKIVILDFWATWCGPCVVSLPKMVELSQEYRGAEVEFLAVNIEQKPGEIQALLDRLEIKPTVVLDSDGGVARAYSAQAIPQTVIIDRQGNVSHVFVGAGDGAEKRIREALDETINLKL